MTTAGLESFAYGITTEAVKSVVKPALVASFSGWRSLSSAIVEYFGNRFSDYIAQQADRHSCLNTIVFGHRKLLDSLYIPLTVVAVSNETPGDAVNHGILIDRFHTKLYPSHKRVLITDTAGMGKSTLSKFLFLQCIKSCYAVPIFIELRHLSSNIPILSIIQKQLNNSIAAEEEVKFNKRHIERIVKRGELVFFLDGYDEIPFRDRETVTKDIKEFIERYPNNIYTITSRPESGLLAFPAFEQFRIRPLKKEESFQLIRKYDQGGGRAEQLISKLNGRDFRAVQEFLKNPLLTSLLYRSFEYKQSVPIKKHIFYRQVFDALFDWHDSSKDGYNTREKKSGLDIDNFHRILRVMGFISVMKGQVEGDADTVLTWIKRSKDICSITNFSESSFLDDLIRAVPLFVKDGDYYRWSHKSLAEYFAAQHICTQAKNQQAKVLSAFLESGKVPQFSNVLDQVYDIDTSGFRANLVLPLARAFTVHWNTSYKNLDPQISIESVRLRKCVTFDRIFVLFNMKRDNYDGVKEAIEGAFQAAANTNLDLEANAFNILFLRGASTSDDLLAVKSGPFATILEILEIKKDPLVIHRASLEIASVKNNLRLRHSRPIQIDDDPLADHNSFQNFDRTTNSIAQLGPAVDAERMLAFEEHFRDAKKLSDLTDELLGSILDPTLGQPSEE